MCLIVVHRAARDDGEYQRVRKLSAVVAECLGQEVVEIWAVGPGACLRRARRSALPAPAAGRRLLLPVVLPAFRVKVLFALSNLLQRAGGWAVGRIMKPTIILGETHSAWEVVAGVRKGNPSARVIMDLHGAYAEEIELEYPRSRWRDFRARCARSVEAEVLKESDLIVCQSAAMAAHLEVRHGCQAGRIARFQCGVDTSLFRRDPKAAAALRKELDIPENAPVVIYVGNAAGWQRLDDSISAFAQYARHSGGQPHLIVLTPEDPRAIVDNAIRHGIDRSSVIVRRVAHNEVPRYLSCADAAFLLRSDNVVNRVASPTKLGEYLACGVPIITTAVAKAWPVYGRAAECFLVLEEARREDWGVRISAFLEAARKSTAMRERCREAAKAELADGIDARNVGTALWPRGSANPQ